MVAFDLARAHQPWDDLQWATGSFAFFFVVDLLFKYVVEWFPSDANGRYLTLHIFCNAFVTVVHWDDVQRSCKP